MNILLCPLSDGGYLYPAIAIGRELHRRGHRIDVLGRARVAPLVAESGLPFVAAEDVGESAGFSAAVWGRTGMAQFRAVRRAAVQTRADVIVTSVLCPGALVAAEVLGLPVVVVGLATHIWDYAAGGWDEPLGAIRHRRTREMAAALDTLREQAGLRGRGRPGDQTPLLGDAFLLRGVPGFEYPGTELPSRVQHIGPLAWEPAPDPDELDDLRRRLDRTGKPVVYVHLGRFFEGIDLWPALNAAFTGGPFQAVVERGRSRDPQPAHEADIVLVHRPWLGPLIDRAGMVLSSATSAPVLAALLRGRPLALAPNGAEQPYVAAACERAGVGVRIPRSVTPDAAERLVRIWRDEDMRGRARELGRALAAMDGAAQAVAAIEQVGVEKYSSVLTKG